MRVLGRHETLYEHRSDFLPLLLTSHVYKLLRVSGALNLSWEVKKATPGHPAEERPRWNRCLPLRLLVQSSSTPISPPCRGGGTARGQGVGCGAHRKWGHGIKRRVKPLWWPPVSPPHGRSPSDRRPCLTFQLREDAV